MDIRIVKTKKAIINAFLELRAKKAIEKITVKELCEKAAINKSTFYTHFKDIYDLSEHLEIQVVNEIVKSLEHPEYALSDPKIFNRELHCAYLANESLIHILFSGSRTNMLLIRIEESLREIIFSLHPDYKNDVAANIVFTFEIYGGFYTFEKCRHFGEDTVIEIMSSLNQKISEILRQSDH